MRHSTLSRMDRCCRVPCTHTGRRQLRKRSGHIDPEPTATLGLKALRTPETSLIRVTLLLEKVHEVRVASHRFGSRLDGSGIPWSVPTRARVGT